MPTARLNLFGTPKIVEDGICIETFPTRRCVAILAVLALEPRQRMSRRALADHLWPEEPFEVTGPRLRQELSRLRRSLEELAPLIVTDLKTVSLREGAVDCDVKIFRQVLEEASKQTGVEAESRLREAIDLSQAPYFETSDEPWVLTERQRLIDLRLNAVDQLCEVLRLRGELDESNRIAIELGAPRTERRSSFQLNPSERASAVLVVPPIGRESEMERLQRWLHPDHGAARLVTLLGPGGVGKSHLLRRSAKAFESVFGGNVTFADLSELTDSRFVPDAILSALELGYLPAADPQARLEQAFIDSPYLLCLDNLEQFGLAMGPMLSRLLRANPQLRILTSSRVAISIQEEFRLSLSPLAIPSAGSSVDEAIDSASVRVFREMVQASGIELPREATDWESVIAVVRHLEGMPLSLRLAAARLRALSPRELYEALQVDPDGNQSTDADTPGRHRSLRHTIAGSFELLTPEMRKILGELSVLRGGWSLAGAQTVTGVSDPASVMDVLLSASMVERVPNSDPMRFCMLESVRAFAGETLDPSRQLDLSFRHVLWLVETTDFQAGAPVDERALQRFSQWEQDADNLREAVRFAMDFAPDLAFRLAGNLGPFWFHRTNGYEANAIYEELFRRHGDRKATQGMLAAALGHGWIAHLLAFPGKPEIYRRGIQIGRELGDRSREASFLALLGLYAQNSMDYSLGEEIAVEIERHRFELGTGDAEGTILRLQGLVSLYKGDIRGAIQLYRRSVEWFRGRGEVFGYASARLHLVLAAIEMRDLDLAEIYLDGLREDIERIRFDSVFPAVLSVQGCLDAHRGRTQQAIGTLTTARDLWKLHGSPFRAHQQDYELGRVHYADGRFEESGHSFVAAAVGWNRSGYSFAAAIALVGVAGTLWQQGYATQSRRVMASARRHIELSNARVIDSQRRFELEILAAMGEPVEEADLSLDETITLVETLCRFG